VRRKPPILHPSDLSREYLWVKCPCRQILRVPVEGCECSCGQSHVRQAELSGKVRERTITCEEEMAG
jgi:hypothetical protein